MVTQEHLTVIGMVCGGRHDLLDMEESWKVRERSIAIGFHFAESSEAGSQTFCDIILNTYCLQTKVILM